MNRAPKWDPERLRGLERAVRDRLDSGDLSRAVALVVEGLGPSVRAYLRTLLQEDDADEAFLEFQENVLKGLRGFRWQCPLRAWTHRVAFHSASRIWRRPERRFEVPLPSSASRLGPGSKGPPPGASGRHAGLALLRRNLSVEDQTLLTLRVDRELEWEEIAVVLGEEENGEEVVQAVALRKRYERLTRRLREEARRHGLID